MSYNVRRAFAHNTNTHTLVKEISQSRAERRKTRAFNSEPFSFLKIYYARPRRCVYDGVYREGRDRYLPMPTYRFALHTSKIYNKMKWFSIYMRLWYRPTVKTWLYHFSPSVYTTYICIQLNHLNTIKKIDDVWVWVYILII